jgi:hypothetical protein
VGDGDLLERDGEEGEGEPGEGIRLRREGESEHALTAFCSHIA